MGRQSKKKKKKATKQAISVKLAITVGHVVT